MILQTNGSAVNDIYTINSILASINFQGPDYDVCWGVIAKNLIIVYSV